MRRLLQFLHHRSLTVSIIALVLGFYALAFLPEHSYRLHHQGAAFLTQAGIAVVLGLFWCIFTLFILLRDNRSGYPNWDKSEFGLTWSPQAALSRPPKNGLQQRSNFAYRRRMKQMNSPWGAGFGAATGQFTNRPSHNHI